MARWHLSAAFATSGLTGGVGVTTGVVPPALGVVLTVAVATGGVSVAVGEVVGVGGAVGVALGLGVRLGGTVALGGVVADAGAVRVRGTVAGRVAVVLGR